MILADLREGVTVGGGAPLLYLFLGLVLFVGIAALSHARERAFSASLVYLLLGLAAGLVVRAADLARVLDPIRDARLFEHVTEAAVVIALFATGLRIPRPPSLRLWQSPLRLLLVAMPLTIGAAALWGAVGMGLTGASAIALGAALAPTDPVLAGQLGVGPPEAGGESPEAEFALTAEAGFNDGLAMPFLVLALTLAAGDGLVRWALADLLYGVSVALALGIALGYGLAAPFRRLRSRGLLHEHFDPWVPTASALVVYGVVEALGGYGFVAVFAAGIAFRAHDREDRYNRDIHDRAEVLMSFSELVVMLLLGSSLVLMPLHAPGTWGWLLVPALLVVIRPAAVLLALARAPLPLRDRVWVAWFGVKGVASLNYAALIVAAGSFADTPALVWTVVAAVAVSVVVHGTSATPLTRRLLGRD